MMKLGCGTIPKDGLVVKVKDYSNGTISWFYGILLKNNGHPSVSEWYIKYFDGNDCAVLRMEEVYSATILRIALKRKWYDMIEAGIKKEEYRTIKDYWMVRLIAGGDPANWTKKDERGIQYKEFDLIEFKNGYGHKVPTMYFEFNGIDIGPAVPEWSDNWQGEVFRIKIGKRVDNN